MDPFGVRGSVFLGHCYIGCWVPVWILGVGVGVWLGPAFIKLLVGFLGLGVFSLGREDLRGKWWLGLVTARILRTV